MYTQTKGFTLIEMIIAVSIFAILSTIAFITITDHTKSARDSVRYNDASSLHKALEFYYLKASQYPDPDNYFNVTYSGTLLWKQWIIWETVIESLNTVIDTPMDPLFTTPYTYSVSYDNQFYQIWMLAETSSN